VALFQQAQPITWVLAAVVLARQVKTESILIQMAEQVVLAIRGLTERLTLVAVAVAVLVNVIMAALEAQVVVVQVADASQYPQPLELLTEEVVVVVEVITHALWVRLVVQVL
jgi:hypothetical protein